MKTINTKEGRDNIRERQFADHIKNGYTRENYKDLVIFTGKDNDRFRLRVYRGTSTKDLNKYRYRTQERLNEAVSQYKESADRHEAYRIEKAGTVTAPKITLSTVKSFLKKNEGNLLIKELSSFDGQVDCVMSVQDEFHPAEGKLNFDEKYSLGIPGAHFVGGSRDSFSIHESENLTGYKIYNCCGSFIIAVQKSKQVPEPVRESKAANFEKVEVPDGEIQIIEYSEKSIAVIGATKPIKDDLKKLGGSFNFRLTVGAGWIFKKTDLNRVQAFLGGLSTAKMETVQSNEPEEINEPETPETSEAAIIEVPQTNIFKEERHEKAAKAQGEVNRETVKPKVLFTCKIS